MYIYILAILFTFVLMKMSSYFRKKNIVIGELGYFISMLPMSVIAGLRDYSVGRDIFTYGNKIFNDAAIFGFHYSAVVNKRWGEPGYVLLNYIVSRFTNNPHWFYFILCFICSYLAYIFFRKLDSEIYVPVAMLLYNFFLYFLGLGVLRQGLAISVLAFSFYFFYKQKPFKGIIFGIIAFFFHDSSILIFLVYFVLYSLVSIFLKNGRKYFAKLTVASFFIAMVFPIIFMKLPPSLFTLINDKYYYVANSIDFTNISYARMIIFMFPVLYFWKTIYTTFSTRKNLLFLYLVVIVNIAFSAYSGSMYVLFGRGSYYMYMPFIFFIGKCVNLQTVPTKKNIHYIIFILYAFLAFIYLIYRENYNDVFPFVVDPLISI